MRALVAMVLVGCGAKPAPVPVKPPPIEPEKPAAVVAWDKLTGPIRSASVNCPDQTLGAKAKDMLASEIGQPIDRARLRKALATLFESGASDVSTRAVQLADGVKLVVDIAPQPNVLTLTARESGGSEIKLPSQLVAALGLPLDPTLIDATAQTVRDNYRARGFLEVTAEWKASAAKPGTVDVVIEVVPGKAVTIDRVEFSGAAHAKRDELLTAIGPELAPGKPWQKDYIERAGLLVQALYFDRGYVNISIDTPAPQGEKAPLTFVVHEGAQFRIRKLAVSGVPADQIKKYQKLIQLKSGEVFNRTVVIAAIKRLQDAVVADGSPNGAVSPETQVDGDKKVIDMTFAITK